MGMAGWAPVRGESITDRKKHPFDVLYLEPIKDGRVAPRYQKRQLTDEQSQTIKDLAEGRETAFFKVADRAASNYSWWWMDDLARAIVGDGFISHNFSGWNFTTVEAINRLKVVFTMLGIENELLVAEENTEFHVREAQFSHRHSILLSTYAVTD